jgi:hypothetical protein
MQCQLHTVRYRTVGDGAKGPMPSGVSIDSVANAGHTPRGPTSHDEGALGGVNLLAERFLSRCHSNLLKVRSSDPRTALRRIAGTGN